jgi:hypothetical protein
MHAEITTIKSTSAHANVAAAPAQASNHHSTVD